MTTAHLTNRCGAEQKASGRYQRLSVCKMPRAQKPLSALLAVFCVFALVACTTSHTAATAAIDSASYLPNRIDWQPICNGADYAVYISRSFPVRYHCVRLDLTVQGLTVTAFPATESDFKRRDGRRTPLFVGKRTGAFARQSGATIAINTSPFAGSTGAWDLHAHLTRTRQIVGTHLIAGNELATPNSRYCALVLTRDEQGFRARIIDNQSTEALDDADYAFGGFWTVLRAGEVLPFAVETHDSRTACGISDDGRTLYLLAVEGEHQRSSRGLSFPECAEVLQRLGANDAMQFDGGGSTALYINGKNMLSYPCLRINAASVGFVITTAHFR